MIKFNQLYAQLFWNKEPLDLLIGTAISFVVFIIFKLCANLLSKHARFIAQKVFKAKEKNFEDAITATISKPINYFVTISGIFIAVLLLPFGPEVSLIVDGFATKVVI